jgi:hypothetical protein
MKIPSEKTIIESANSQSLFKTFKNISVTITSKCYLVCNVLELNENEDGTDKVNYFTFEHYDDEGKRLESWHTFDTNYRNMGEYYSFLFEPEFGCALLVFFEKQDSILNADEEEEIELDCFCSILT